MGVDKKKTTFQRTSTEKKQSLNIFWKIVFFSTSIGRKQKDWLFFKHPLTVKSLYKSVSATLIFQQFLNFIGLLKMEVFHVVTVREIAGDNFWQHYSAYFRPLKKLNALTSDASVYKVHSYNICMTSLYFRQLSILFTIYWFSRCVYSYLVLRGQVSMD